jgi:Protein of unknown function (DUF3800)
MPNVYIDASGRPGEITEPGEVPYCTYTAVFMTQGDADAKLNDIHAIKMRELPPGRREFKSSQPHSANLSFLQGAVSGCQWSFYVVVGFKSDFDNYGLKYPEPCNKWFVKNALQQLPQALASGRVAIDEGSSESKDRDLLAYLRRQFDPNRYPAIRDAVCVKSHEIPGVQLADLISGAYRRYYKSAFRKGVEYVECLRGREMHCWEFPPKEWRLDKA